MSNIKLGIRVRPFTERELRLEKDQALPVVNIVDDNTVTITNVKVSVSGAGDSRERVRRYFADYAFDSCCLPTRPSYASQQKVFDTIGREVVASVVKGCSACVLAYGQSATGKTYTMMGTEEDPGLVPRVCRALAEEQSLDLTVSFLEIYNERVHDLLGGGGEGAPECHSLPRRRGNARKDLRVREHPSRGPYVQNLRRIAVTDVEGLLSLVREGSRRRRTAATRRNPTSSRSHALLEIATPHATLHLADLAGSEKAGWEGCGGRQKEGANINKSLVALSNVISALVSGGGSGRGRFVPYRDSALTWLLKDCFTGGARTFIIATVSPSVACYGESASTLRWAARARQLPAARPARASTNVRPAVHTHYTTLIAELARHFIQYVPETGKIVYHENHWKLPENILNIRTPCEKTAKIGNIMNLLHPKAGEDGHSESTASSVASGSSDVINAMDKNIKIDISSEISKEVDKLFGPALERTQSNSDLKVIAPLRHKRRQYKSQEILTINEKLHMDTITSNVLPSHSEAQMVTLEKSSHSEIPILYDNQRAEIVASVTERLYNKIKKKEEAAASKVESVIDKKVMEPLSELRICTNARQRLAELSQKALRNKRKIGIPAHTQTRKIVTRVRDQGVDVQTDLEAYIYKSRHLYSLRKDATTETIPMTPRCKEIAVGSMFGMLDFHDRSTITEEKKIIHKNSLVMTDIVRKCEISTQTQVVPPPRRKRRSRCCKCIRETNKSVFTKADFPPVISINISQTIESETQSSDENSEDTIETSEKPLTVNMTPDLLTNHNTVEANVKENARILISNKAEEKVDEKHTVNENHTGLTSQGKISNDFPDTEDCELPRVTVGYSRRISNPEEIKNMILGRRENDYSYSIVLSPPRDEDALKSSVQFVDDDIVQVTSTASQTDWDLKNKNCENEVSKQSQAPITAQRPERQNEQLSKASTCSDSTDTSKVETDSFVWKKVNPSQYHKTNSLARSYTPAYRSMGSKHAKAKASLYREFLGLNNDYNDRGSQHSSKKSSPEITSSDSAEAREVSNDIFRQRRSYLEDKLRLKFRRENSYKIIEQELLNSCNSLEASVNRYESYLSNHQYGKDVRRDSLMRTPTEYLHHLVQLRREMVRADCDTDSSFSNVPR